MACSSLDYTVFQRRNADPGGADSECQQYTNKCNSEGVTNEMLVFSLFLLSLGASVPPKCPFR